MEGVLADECYHQAKEEGCGLEIISLEGDSSSQKSVIRCLGKCLVKCGRHVGHTHGTNLKNQANQKIFSATQKYPNRKDSSQKWNL